MTYTWFTVQAYRTFPQTVLQRYGAKDLNTVCLPLNLNWRALTFVRSDITLICIFILKSVFARYVWRTWKCRVLTFAWYIFTQSLKTCNRYFEFSYEILCGASQHYLKGMLTNWPNLTFQFILSLKIVWNLHYRP